MEFRCPLCSQSVSPDFGSSGQQTVACPSCQMSVLLYRSEGSTGAAPIAWPTGFAIAEIPPCSASVQLGNGVYRTHEVPRPPGLAITQEILRDGKGLLARAIVAGELFIAAVIALATGASHAVTVCFLGGLFVLLWSLVAARHKRRTIRADQQGLHWRRTTWTTHLRDRTLVANDIAQLYVRNTSLLTESWVPRFTLYARDRGGNDHAITELETPEQAWWLEDRLERHLGLVGRTIAGEYRRPELPAAR